MRKLIAIGSLLAVGVLPLAAAPNNAGEVPPHYEIRTPNFWRYLTSDSLPLNNVKNIKSVSFIDPEYEDDAEVMAGTVHTFNYNRSGLLTSGSLEYGDAAGGYSFKVDYSDSGIPSKITWTSQSPTQDPPEVDWSVVTEYIPLYNNGGRLQQIRETTVSVGGKKCSGVHKYVVTPAPSGAPKKVVCLEDNSKQVTFDNNGLMQACNIYTYAGNPSGPVWELTSSPVDFYVLDTDDDIPASDWQYTLDTKGNWTRKSAKYESSDFLDSGEAESVHFCNIEYY